MKNLFNNQLKYLSFHKNTKLLYNMIKDNKGIKTSSIQNNNKKNDIESLNNKTSLEIKENNKEATPAFSASPENLVNKQSLANLSNKKTCLGALPLATGQVLETNPVFEKNRVAAISKKTPTIYSTANARQVLTLTEGDWREMWSRKFTKFLRLGLYTPDLLDKLLFTYLNEKKQNIKSKYTFNDLLSSSQLITYNFNKNIKKVDLNSLYKYLKSFFRTLSSLISFPALEIYPDKIKIRLFYFVIPSKTKQNLHKSLHKYIRSDEKLYKEKNIRRNFNSIMEKFKIKLFIAKWKEDNNFIRTPSPISFFKGLTVGHLILPSNDLSDNRLAGTASLENKQFKSVRALLKKKNLEQLHDNLRSSNDEFNRPYEYNKPLDLLKMDLFKLSQQHNQLKSLIGLTLTDKTPDSVIIQSEPEELQSKSTSLISKETTLQMLDPDKNNTNQESLKNLKDRKVSTIVSLNKDKFKYLIFTLEKVFKKTIILDLIRLKYPYHESNILAQVLSLSCKTKDFNKIMRKLLYYATISNPTKTSRKKNFSIIPSYLSGIKVRLGGRLITQRLVPRFTVQSFQTGSLARGKVNFTDTSRITLKNKRGAFSFTVTTSHIF